MIAPDAASRRAEFLAGVRAQAPLLLGVAPFGMAYGAYAANAGLPTGLALAMSFVVFGGASQFVAVRLIVNDVPAAIIVLTVLLVNMRHMLYSAALAPFTEALARRWRWLLAYLLTDEAYATAITRYRRGPGSAHAHWFFFGTGAALWATWQVTTALGVFAGTAVPDSWSLDFALPLTFLAILMPAVRARAAALAALAAGLVAVAGFRWPYGIGLLTAMVVGMALGMAADALAGEAGRTDGEEAGVRLWLIVLAAGIGTYGIRLSVLVFVHHSALPRPMREALRFVTPAVLAAIILPAVVYTRGSGHFDASPGNERLVAGIVAAGVAWVTKSVWATIAVGMAALWLLQWAG